jgi:osmotically-inducible protein OsmY
MVTRALSLFLIFALVVPLLAQGTPADNKIYDQVRQKLANDPEVKGANLDVVVKNGAVTLTGTVNDIRAKEKAEKDTKKVKGVTSVVNELKIFGT